MQNEKDKGCLYIHPAAFDQKKEISTEKDEPSQSDSEETDPEYAGMLFKTVKRVQSDPNDILQINCCQKSDNGIY